MAPPEPSVTVIPAERSGPIAAGGTFAVPSRFTAWVDDETQPYLIGLDIRVTMAGAEVLMTQLQWRDWNSPGGVTTKGLRAVKLGTAVQHALKAARFQREEIEQGPLAGHFRLSGDPPGVAHGGPGIRADGRPFKGGPGRGRVMSNEHLEEVADVYRDALSGGKPVEAVREHFSTNRSTASRWVGEARKRDILEESTRRDKS